MIPPILHSFGNGMVHYLVDPKCQLIGEAPEDGIMGTLTPSIKV